MARNIKVVVIGDAEVGKSDLIFALQRGESSADAVYFPTFTDYVYVDVEHHGLTHSVNFSDMASHFYESHNVGRMFFSGTHVFFVCFSMNSKDSLENVWRRWQPYISIFCPNVPIILVGTKLDKSPLSFQKTVTDSTWEASKIWPTVRAQKKFEHRTWRIKRFVPLFRRHTSPRFPAKNGACKFDGICDEILVLILSFLDTPDLGRLAQVNKRFKNIVSDRFVWLGRDKRIQANDCVSVADIDMVAKKIKAAKVVLTSAVKYLNVVELLQQTAEVFESSQQKRNSILLRMFK